MTLADEVVTAGGRRALDGPTLVQVRRWPATVDVRRACSALGISASWGYALVKAGDFPCRVLMIRGRARVVTASLLATLEEVS